MSFTKKLLSASFSLSNGNFDGGGNIKKVDGLRMSARIATAGGDDTGTMVLMIYGMTLSDMNALTVLPATMTSVGKNSVTLMAGEEGGAMQTVFQGTIMFAAVEANSQPAVAFRIQATAGQVEAVRPVPVLSQPGSQDAATLFGAIAKSMGRTLEISGVSAKIQNPYLPGTAKQQASALARAFGLQWTLDGNSLAVWPAGQPRQGATTTISKDTGLVGYPTFTASGLVIVTEFQNTLKFGCKINVQSSLTPACGDWYVVYLEYALDSMTPNGKWFATLTAGKINVGNNAGG